MTALHAHFQLRNQRTFQRLLDASKPGAGSSSSASSAATPGPALSTSGGRSWHKSSPLSGNQPPSSVLDVNAKDWLGRTALHLAVSSIDIASLEYVKLLLSHPRINVNLTDKESRWTPLHRALYTGNLPATVLLLQRPDIDLSLKDFEGYTALDVYNSTVEGTKPGADDVLDLFTWGTNRNALLGIGDGNDRAHPEAIQIPSQNAGSDDSSLSIYERFLPTYVEDAKMAKLHMAVVTAETRGNVRVCGFGNGGRLGAGTAQHTQFALAPIKDLSSESISSVALGQDHTLALTHSGSLLSWGLNRFSQLGYVLDGDATIQLSPRRIVGPLKKEFVVGVAACRTASACWTDSELFTWGTNGGQLGYDKAGTPVQALPRRVTQITHPVIGVCLSDCAMVVLLKTRDVLCFWNGRSFKINFPTHAFPSQIQAYRPPMAQRNEDIAKVVNCEDTFAALSANGEVFTFTLNAPAAQPAADRPSTLIVKPQRIWSLRKQFSAVRDVALGSEGTILLSTESGHVYLRSRTNSSSSFARIQFVQRVVSVSASSSGAFAVLRAAVRPDPIRVAGNSVSEDFRRILPFFLAPAKPEWLIEDMDTPPASAGKTATPPTSGGSATSGTTAATSSSVEDEEKAAEDDLEEAALKQDVQSVLKLVDLIDRDSAMRKVDKKGLYDGWKMRHGADLFVRVDSGFKFPVHRVVLASRSEPLRSIFSGQVLKHADGRTQVRLNRGDAGQLLISGVHPLSILMLATYLYSDSVSVIWDRRVSEQVAEKLSRCSPKTSVDHIRADLSRLAMLLRLPELSAILDAPVKRAPESVLPRCMGELLVKTQLHWGSSSEHKNDPCAYDTILQLEDARVFCHSTVLRARSPFFAALFDDDDWTRRRREDGTVLVHLEHARDKAMEYVMKFLYAGGEVEMFDALDFAHLSEDVVDFMFEVVDIAEELLLDRLSLICSSVILRFLNIANACHILISAAHFNATQLASSVQGFIAKNLETMLESRMLDDLPISHLRQLAAFIRERQAEKLPLTKSNRMVNEAMEKWKEWAAEQDFPQVIVQSRRVSNPVKKGPKLSPVAPTAGGRDGRTDQTAMGSVMAMPSTSPPVEARMPSVSSTALTRETATMEGEDLFVMDGVHEDGPQMALPGPQTSPSPAKGSAGSPWKVRPGLPSSKSDLRSIMAEAESQRPSTPTPVSRPTPVTGEGSSKIPINSRPTRNPIQDSGMSQSKSDSPWRISSAGPSSSPEGPTSIMRAQRPTETPRVGPSRVVSFDPSQSPPRSQLQGPTTPKKIPSSLPGPPTQQASQASLGKGKSPMGPTITPSRQAAPTQGPSSARRVSEGSSRAWSTVPLDIPSPPPVAQPGPSSTTPTSSPPKPVSFLTIQQQQRDADLSGPSRPKKSLLEIQQEERARADQEQARGEQEREEREFMRWWAMEEERIRRETQAQPGPPVGPPGVGVSGRGKGRGRGRRDAVAGAGGAGRGAKTKRRTGGEMGEMRNEAPATAPDAREREGDRSLPLSHGQRRTGGQNTEVEDGQGKARPRRPRAKNTNSQPKPAAIPPSTVQDAQY